MRPWPKLAQYLKEQEYFQDSINATVQLIRIKDTFNINFVVDQSRITEGYEKIPAVRRIYSEKIRQKTGGDPTTNDRFEPFKNLQMVPGPFLISTNEPMLTADCTLLSTPALPAGCFGNPGDILLFSGFLTKNHANCFKRLSIGPCTIGPIRYTTL